MRRAAKIDANQNEIVEALRDAGYSVCVTSVVGQGFPDLIVGKGGIPRTNVLMELKDGSLPPSKRKLTPQQVEFHRNWQGPICVVETVEDALLMMECANHGGTS